MNKKFANILAKQEREDGKTVLSEAEIVRKILEEFENGEELLRCAELSSADVAQFFSDDGFPSDWPVVPIRRSGTFSIRKHTSVMRPYYHGHRFYEIVSVQRGTCKQTFRNPDRSLVLGERRVCVVAPGTVHAVGRARPGDVVLKLIVPAALFSKTALPVYGTFPPETVRVYENVSAEVDYFLFKLMDAQLNRRAHRSAVIESYLTLLFAELERDAERTDGVLSDRLEEYFDACAGSASLGDFAAALKYSEGYTGRLLKEKLGKNFSELLNSFRLKRSAELLAGTEASVEEIAEAVGYSNASGLYKQFCGYYGMTPNAYRKMFR